MVNSNLLRDIQSFCDLNNIEDVNLFINELLQKQFTIEKFGLIPFNKKSNDDRVTTDECKKINEENILLKKKIIELEAIIKNEVKTSDKKDMYGE